MVSDFKWPQVWVTDLAIDQQLGGGFLGTLEVIYGNDINNVFVRNADLRRAGPDAARRPAVLWRRSATNELNPDGGAGIYVIDNTDDGLLVQRDRAAPEGVRLRALGAAWATATRKAKNNLKSSEIASVLWPSQPIQGNPNNPELSYSEFGQRHRIVGGATYIKPWSPQPAHADRRLLRGGRGQPLRRRGRQPVLVHLLRRRERRRSGTATT